MNKKFRSVPTQTSVQAEIHFTPCNCAPLHDACSLRICTLHTNSRGSFHHICCRFESWSHIHRQEDICYSKYSDRLKSTEASFVLSDKRRRSLVRAFLPVLLYFCFHSTVTAEETLIFGGFGSRFCSQLAARCVMIKALIVHSGAPLFSVVFCFSSHSLSLNIILLRGPFTAE